MKRTVYRIFDNDSKQYLGSNGKLVSEADAKEFVTKSSARRVLARYVNLQLYGSNWRWYSKTNTDFKSKNIKYNLDIQEVTITYNVGNQDKLEDTLRNLVLAARLREESYNLSHFWEQATNTGFANDINYVMRLEMTKGQPYSETIKIARDGIRQLGIKTRTFREYQGVFGFYNKDQALKARLTIASTEFVDIEALRKEIF